MEFSQIMLWQTSQPNLNIESTSERDSYLWRSIKALWRFSQFYGEYQALPPSERRNSLEELERRYR